ncbi:MAG: hypothetical protein AAGE03_07735 [Pseudomonadota bacterium]
MSDAAILTAHQADDRARLVTLYAEAAAARADDARAFFLTHAWIFALEAGDARADDLRQALARMGRV